MVITASEQRAISKAMHLELAAQVERMRWGGYLSQSRQRCGGRVCREERPPCIIFHCSNCCWQ